MTYFIQDYDDYYLILSLKEDKSTIWCLSLEDLTKFALSPTCAASWQQEEAKTSDRLDTYLRSRYKVLDTFPSWADIPNDLQSTYPELLI